MAEWVFNGPIALGENPDPAFEIDLVSYGWMPPIGIPVPGLAPNSVRFEYDEEVSGRPFRLQSAPTEVVPDNPPILVPTFGTVQ